MKLLHVGTAPRSTCVTSVCGENTVASPITHEDRLGAEVGQGEEDVEARRLLDADDVQEHQQQHHDRAGVDVVRVAQQVATRPELGQVVRHEDRRDRDGHRVVQHLRPAGEEAHELVERVPGERCRAAGLREPRSRLGVRHRREEEDDPRDEERDRREPERVDRHQAEGVVDRRAHVSVGGREQRRRAEHAVKSPGLAALYRHWCLLYRVPGQLLVTSQQRNDEDRDDVGDLDHRVDGGAGGVLVRITDRVTRDGGRMRR